MEKIEYKLFSHISINRRGQPLTSHKFFVDSIATTTTSDLNVHAELDTSVYPTGVKIPDPDMVELESSGTLARHEWHPEWNYTFKKPTHQPNDQWALTSNIRLFHKPPRRIPHLHACGQPRAAAPARAPKKCSETDFIPLLEV
ncbi:ISAzo13-like element transposase-related protein [Arthrobacter psychrolactophilus]